MVQLALNEQQIDTAPPGASRRRVWYAPDVQSHSLLALTLTRLYLAPSGPPPRPKTVSAILDGADLDSTFGPFALVIDLQAVSRMKLDLGTNTLTIEYDPTRGRPGSGTVGRAPRAEVIITCTEHATADDIFTKIWRRLGQRFTLKRHGTGAEGGTRKPLAIMGGVLAATAIISLMSAVVSDLSDPPQLLAPFASFDWRWVCGLGGATLAGLQLWLYRRLTRPPTALELVAIRT